MQQYRSHHWGGGDFSYEDPEVAGFFSPSSSRHPNQPCIFFLARYKQAGETRHLLQWRIEEAPGET